MMAETQEDDKPIFTNISGEDGATDITEIESLCMNCHEQGITRLLLTRIPFFKEVVVSSFSCDHCHYKSAELQPVGKIQEKGVKITVFVNDEKDLSRQVVQTSDATVTIPSLDFEIPPNKGALTTIEGILDKSIEGLQMDQAERRVKQPEIAQKIDEFLFKISRLKLGLEPFELVLDDPSGNSFVENPYAPKPDKNTRMEHYKRTKEQDESMGLATEPAVEASPELKPGEVFEAKDEVVTFPTDCPNCNAPAETNMKTVSIPHFKEVIIMATVCDKCGFRDNEVKAGQGIEEKGKKITLHITDPSDMTRDVLKGDHSSVAIPELDFSTCAGTLGGKFTTLEGLLNSVQEQLVGSNPFIMGDSSKEENKNTLSDFCGKLQQVMDGKLLNVHFVIDDPSGNSYLQNFYAPDEDPEMKIEYYIRNFEQNEQLGLNDMKTENYEES